MSTYDGPVGTCGICHNQIALDFILQHLKVVHDIDAVPAEWPDGSSVIIDQTLEPVDFEDDA